MIEILISISDVAVLVFLVTSMSGIGLGLKLAQIVGPLRNGKLVSRAVLANFILAPLLAAGIARLLRLDEPFAAGLLLLGLAAGAPFMPKIAEIAHGDPGLSVGLMVLLMAGTTVFLPTALPLLVKGAEVDAWEIARFLIVLMLLPLAAGLVVKAWREPVAARLRPVFVRTSNIAVLGVVILMIVIHFPAVLRIFGTGAILAALLFSALSALAGWLIGCSERTVLALVTGLRNVPAALIVGVRNFKDPNVAVMVIVTTLVGILILLPAARWMGKRT